MLNNKNIEHHFHSQLYANWYAWCSFGTGISNGRGALGSELLLLASSIGLVLSMLAFAQTNIGYKKKMVMPPFDRCVKGAKTSKYRTRIKAGSEILDSVPPGTRDGKTGDHRLLSRTGKRQISTQHVRAQFRKTLGCCTCGKKYKIGAAEFNKRIRMLFDTQYTIELFHEQLVELLRAAEIS